MKIGEFFFQILFKSEDKKLKDFVSAIGELNLRSVLAVAGLGQVYDIMEKLQSMTTKTAVGLYKFRVETGLSTKELQQWAKFAERFGVSQEELQQGVESTLENMAKIRTIGGDVTPFQRWAVALSKDPFKMLDQVADRMEQMRSLGKDATDQFEMMMVTELGWSRGMVTVLNEYIKNREELKKIGFINDDLIKKQFELNAKWVALGQSISLNAQKAVMALSPIFTGLLQAIDFMTKLQNSVIEIVKWFIKLGKVIAETLGNKLLEAAGSGIKLITPGLMMTGNAGLAGAGISNNIVNNFNISAGDGGPGFEQKITEAIQKTIDKAYRQTRRDQ